VPTLSEPRHPAAGPRRAATALERLEMPPGHTEVSGTGERAGGGVHVVHLHDDEYFAAPRGTPSLRAEPRLLRSDDHELDGVAGRLQRRVGANGVPAVWDGEDERGDEGRAEHIVEYGVRA
jgi:hypothetical protein